MAGTKVPMKTKRLIESDSFPFEFLSALAEKESWRKEVHRPLSYLHKWWAKRLGSVFRGIVLGCALTEDDDLEEEFYRQQNLSLIVLDPFMGSGTTVYECHKLGCTALGRDINPVAVEAVKTALGPMDRASLQAAFEKLSTGVGEKLLALYRSVDSRGRVCDVLYYFWVMQATCPSCHRTNDLFPSWIIARYAYPARRPEVQLLCPSCGLVFPGLDDKKYASCPSCGHTFDPKLGTARGATATCSHCGRTYPIIGNVGQQGPPKYRLYAKLVLTQDGRKEYLAVTSDDLAAYEAQRQLLAHEVGRGAIQLPNLMLTEGHNTRQALNYGFRSWRDFFNDRQLLALGWLHKGIRELPDQQARAVLLTLFSGILEFNNMFASYKGEGTGAVRHMFSHHILKPERTPIEANVWGTSESSGSFSGMFKARLLRAIDYRQAPREIRLGVSRGIVASSPFEGRVQSSWPTDGSVSERGVYLSCGDSSRLELPDRYVDAVVTDPPFFDNVHYSELADFFYAWQQLDHQMVNSTPLTTRTAAEVQDTDPQRFEEKLRRVFAECHRVMKDEGLLVFTFHHSRDEAWEAVARSILKAGFVVVNAHPVKSEMSVAVPKAQAKDPIQVDTIIVCRKAAFHVRQPDEFNRVLLAARDKARRLQDRGFSLSRNDQKVILAGQLLTAVRSPDEVPLVMSRMATEAFDLEIQPATSPQRQAAESDQLALF